MALDIPTFFKRLGSAIVFSAVMMGGLLWNEWAFAALLSIIMLLCIREFFILIPKIFKLPKASNSFVFSFCLVALLALALVFTGLFYPDSVWIIKLLMAVISGFVGVLLLKSLLQKQENLFSFATAAMAVLYICISLFMLLYLRYLSLCIPLALILMIWMNDTMAYLVGSFIGKTPFSKISPKKTWEGTLGGVFLTLLSAAIWGYYSPYYHIADWMVLALCASIAGTAGDLFESKLKRLADVKDSGTMMPGHGGALDRFDSLLITTPFAFAYAIVFMTPLPLVVF